jgi:uncharacterized protein (TIGR03067 family)
MMRPLFAFLLVVGTALAADADAELKALQGTWTLDAATLDGRDHTEIFAGMKLTLKGNEFATDFAGNSDQGTFTIDAAKSPKRIDIKTGEKGPFKGKTLPGIYKIDGDTLVICCHADAKTRPEEFAAHAKTRNMLLTYKRQK